MHVDSSLALDPTEILVYAGSKAAQWCRIQHGYDARPVSFFDNMVPRKPMGRGQKEYLNKTRQERKPRIGLTLPIKFRPVLAPIVEEPEMRLDDSSESRSWSTLSTLILNSPREDLDSMGTVAAATPTVNRGIGHLLVHAGGAD